MHSTQPQSRHGSQVPMDTMWREDELEEAGEEEEGEHASLLRGQDDQTRSSGMHSHVHEANGPPSGFVQQLQHRNQAHGRAREETRPVGSVRSGRLCCCSRLVCMVALAAVVLGMLVVFGSMVMMNSTVQHLLRNPCFPSDADKLPLEKRIEFPAGVHLLKVLVDAPDLHLRLNVTEDAHATQVHGRFRSKKWASHTASVEHDTATIEVKAKGPTLSRPCVSAVLEVFVPSKTSTHLNVTVLRTSYSEVDIVAVQLPSLSLNGMATPVLKDVKVQGKLWLDSSSVDMQDVDVQGPIVVGQNPSSPTSTVIGTNVKSNGFLHMVKTPGSVKLSDYEAHGDVSTRGKVTFKSLRVADPAKGVHITMLGKSSNIDVDLHSSFQGSFNATAIGTIFVDGIRVNGRTASGKVHGGGNSVLVIRDDGPIQLGSAGSVRISTKD